MRQGLGLGRPSVFSLSCPLPCLFFAETFAKPAGFPDQAPHRQ